MIRIQIDIKDDDAITQAEVVHLFAKDEEATEFLQDIYNSKMQRLFDKIRAGKFTPGKIMAGCTSIYTPSNAHGGYKYDADGNYVKLIYKKDLYDVASAACYENTKIKITHIL